MMAIFYCLFNAVQGKYTPSQALLPPPWPLPTLPGPPHHHPTARHPAPWPEWGRWCWAAPFPRASASVEGGQAIPKAVAAPAPGGMAYPTGGWARGCPCMHPLDGLRYRQPRVGTATAVPCPETLKSTPTSTPLAGGPGPQCGGGGGQSSPSSEAGRWWEAAGGHASKLLVLVSLSQRPSLT